MNVLKFAEEFTHLLNRYMISSSQNDDSSNAVTRLTEAEIVYTIRNVFQALKIKGFEDTNNSSQISSNANVATIPETVSVKYEIDADNKYRCQDIQYVFLDDDTSISDISSKPSEKAQENSFDTLEKETKFISRSNPTICITNLSRSDTFVREENQKAQTEDQGSVKSETENLSFPNASDLFQISLNKIRHATMDIMAHLNNLEQLLPHSMKLLKEVTSAKVQKSPLIHSSPRRTSNVNKTKVSTNIRRSVLPRTPTSSSKSSLTTESSSISERRKSTGGIGTKVSARKSDESKMNYLVSNLNLSNQESPFQPKFTKNPKYAHVRSTIPKAISQKKKMQSNEAVKMK